MLIKICVDNFPARLVSLDPDQSLSQQVDKLRVAFPVQDLDQFDVFLVDAKAVHSDSASRRVIDRKTPLMKCSINRKTALYLQNKQQTTPNTGAKISSEAEQVPESSHETSESEKAKTKSALKPTLDEADREDLALVNEVLGIKQNVRFNAMVSTVDPSGQEISAPESATETSAKKQDQEDPDKISSGDWTTDGEDQPLPESSSTDRVDLRSSLLRIDSRFGVWKSLRIGCENLEASFDDFTDLLQRDSRFLYCHIKSVDAWCSSSGIYQLSVRYGIRGLPFTWSTQQPKSILESPTASTVDGESLSIKPGRRIQRHQESFLADENIVGLRVFEELSQRRRAKRLCSVVLETDLNRSVVLGKPLNSSLLETVLVDKNKNQIVVALFGSYYSRSKKLSSVGCFAGEPSLELRHLTAALEERDSQSYEEAVRRAKVRASVGLNPEKSFWRPDGESSNCAGCGISFGLLVRRHHCRCCGKVFDESCSSMRRIVPEDFPFAARHRHDRSVPGRVCSPCASAIDRLVESEK